MSTNGSIYTLEDSLKTLNIMINNWQELSEMNQQEAIIQGETIILESEIDFNIDPFSEYEDIIFNIMDEWAVKNGIENDLEFGCIVSRNYSYEKNTFCNLTRLHLAIFMRNRLTDFLRIGELENNNLPLWL